MDRKEEILQTFSDINYAYNNCTKYDTLKRMLDELTEPCGDAISRQAALDLIRGLTRWGVRSQDGKFSNVGLLYDDVMFGLDRLQPVTPKQKMGHWVDGCCDCCGTVMAFHIGRCGDCAYTEMYYSNYCPNCGAKMESEG